jgi:DNA-binding transcriptional LysR family regulator
LRELSGIMSQNQQPARSNRQTDWDDYRFFLAVVAAGSLSAAARALHVNTTTVLRRIGHLEESLDVRLFDRLRSGYALTSDGARLLQALDPVDQRLTSVLRDFQSGKSDEKGVVRLGVSEVLATHLLAPSLHRLNAQAPQLQIDIVTDNHLAGPGSSPRVLNHLRDVDLALRLARPTQGDMMVRKLGDMAYGVFAAATYLEGHRSTPTASDLKHHKIIGFLENELPLGPVWWLSRVERTGEVVARSASAQARAAAASAGLGVTALPLILADSYPDLRMVLPPSAVGALEIWLLVRADMAKSPKTRSLIDFLVAEVQEQSAALLGKTA